MLLVFLKVVDISAFLDILLHISDINDILDIFSISFIQAISDILDILCELVINVETKIHYFRYFNSSYFYPSYIWYFGYYFGYWMLLVCLEVDVAAFLDILLHISDIWYKR